MLQLVPQAVAQDAGPFTFPGAQIVGVGDITQFIVKAAPTQTNNLVEIQANDGSQIVTITGVGNTIIDITSTEALLIRKNTDGGDIFTVDTTTPKVIIDANIEFTGPQTITSTSGNVTYAAAGDVYLSPSGNDVLITPTAGQIVDLIFDGTKTSGNIGRLIFRGHNDAAGNVSYGELSVDIVDDTAGSEDSLMNFSVYDDGSSNDVLTLSGGGTENETSFEIKSEMADAGSIILYRFFGRNDGAGQEEYARFGVYIVDPTEDAEYGRLDLIVKRAGALVTLIQMDDANIKMYDDIAFQQASIMSTTAGDFTISPASNLNVTVYSAFGGSHAPLGVVHIDQSVDDAAKPVLVLDQADYSEEFTRYIGQSHDGVLTESLVEFGDEASSAGFAWIKVFIVDDNDQLADQAAYVLAYTLSA